MHMYKVNRYAIYPFMYGQPFPPFKRFLDQGHYYITHMQIIVLKSVSHMYSYIKNWYMIRTGTYTLVSK